MVHAPIEAIEQRDQGFQKLRDLTRMCFFWSAGLLALFSVVGAVTIPGQSPSSTTAPSNSDSSVAPTTDDGQPLQGPATGTFRPGGGRPIAVSGGSH